MNKQALAWFLVGAALGYFAARYLTPAGRTGVPASLAPQYNPLPLFAPGLPIR